MELRPRPKNGFLQKAEWNELYVLTRHWRSNMEFYNDELKFLQMLINKYFMWLDHDTNIDKVQHLAVRLTKATKDIRGIIGRVDHHLHTLEKLIEHRYHGEELTFRLAHAALEDEITDFIITAREIKREIFSTTEEVAGEERLEHLLIS